MQTKKFITQISEFKKKFIIKKIIIQKIPRTRIQTKYSKTLYTRILSKKSQKTLYLNLGLVLMTWAQDLEPRPLVEGGPRAQGLRHGIGFRLWPRVQLQGLGPKAYGIGFRFMAQSLGLGPKAYGIGFRSMAQSLGLGPRVQVQGLESRPMVREVLGSRCRNVTARIQNLGQRLERQVLGLRPFPKVQGNPCTYLILRSVGVLIFVEQIIPACPKTWHLLFL